MNFQVIKQSKKNHARSAKLKTRNTVLATPFFMPIATKAAVKSLTFQDLQALDSDIILANTYHLMVRPGEKLIKQAGGLHCFMNWTKAILTDSGGFQVFSLAKIRKLNKQGVEFSSHIDGKKYFLTPEKSIQIQLDLDSDIIMVLDDCLALPAKRLEIEESVKLSYDWAQRCQKYFIKKTQNKKAQALRQLIFGINQGGLEKDLRIKNAKDLVGLNFDGYAIGGLSVGESEKDMYKVLDWVVKYLPKDKPRYLMGVGRPENIITAVSCGIDMFDCVIPTREARHGRLYLRNSRVKNLFNNPKTCYQQINIKSAKYIKDFSAINKSSKFEVLRKYSRAYLRHLFNTQEPLAIRLATLNNLEFYLELMETIKKQI